MMIYPITVGIIFNNEYNDLNNLLNSLSLPVYKYIEYKIIIICNMIKDVYRLKKIIGIYSSLDITIYYYNYNMGSSIACNKLIDLCKTEYILFCDSDLIVNNYNIFILYETLKKFVRHKNIYSIVPRIVCYGTNKLWFNGLYSKHHNSAVDMFKDSFDFDSKMKYGDLVGTCNLIYIPNYRHLKLRFEDEMFIYHEDVYFSLNKKALCIFQPIAIAEHNIEFEVKKFDIFRHYLMFRNSIILYIKMLDIVGFIGELIRQIKLNKQPLKLRVRALFYGIKLGLLKFMKLYKNKIIDINEFKFVIKLSKYRIILR